MESPEPAGSARPTLRGPNLTIRPGGPAERAPPRAIGAEESVYYWWGEPDPPAQVEADLRGEDDAVMLVIELDGEIAGGIQFHEELTPKYKHAGIDIYLSGRCQGRGAGPEAIYLL